MTLRPNHYQPSFLRILKERREFSSPFSSLFSILSFCPDIFLPYYSLLLLHSYSFPFPSPLSGFTTLYSLISIYVFLFQLFCSSLYKWSGTITPNIHGLELLEFCLEIPYFCLEIVLISEILIFSEFLNSVVKLTILYYDIYCVLNQPYQ